MKGDCATISRLMEENVRLEQRSVMLDRLLFEVERKFPGETRFETALRYIREAEARANEGTAKMVEPNAKVTGVPGFSGTSELTAGLEGKTVTTE